MEKSKRLQMMILILMLINGFLIKDKTGDIKDNKGKELICQISLPSKTLQVDSRS